MASSELFRILGPQIYGGHRASVSCTSFQVEMRSRQFFRMVIIFSPLRLGTKEPTHRVKAMTKLSNKKETLPRSFNALEEGKWAGFISPIFDQGWCGGSWAISTAAVASDRFGIQTKGKEAVVLSPQHLLSCVRKQLGCSGGKCSNHTTDSIELKS